MEDVAPSVLLLWYVRRALDSGQPTLVGIQLYLQMAPASRFRSCIENWWLARSNTQSGQGVRAGTFLTSTECTHQRLYLLELLEASLNGQSIGRQLAELEEELLSACRDEIEEHVARLPLLSLIPLLLMIFPALMLLLLVPLLRMLYF